MLLALMVCISVQAAGMPIDKQEKSDTTASETSKYKLFAPLTFSRTAVNKIFDFNTNAKSSSNTLDGASTNSDSFADLALIAIYLKRPDLVRTTETAFEEATMVEDKIEKPDQFKAEIKEQKVDIIDDIIQDTLQNIVIKKPNFWTIKGDYYLQFLQNYISDNWYKGGESSYSFVASGIIEANYNNKSKLTWDNKLEAKIGFQTSRGDTLHQFKTSEDLLRLTSRLGIQATKNWYYTLQLLAYTQFTSGYKANDPMIYSDFCSPLNINLSVGMSYKVSAFNGKLTGTVLLSPLAYNFRYVGRLALATRNALDEGKHTKHDFGSSLTADLEWKFNDNIKWKTRLYAYTTYKRVEAEWENTFTFNFNKYISTNLFLYPRFDDGAKLRDKDYGYFQFKEYASLGFAYSF